MPKLKFFIVFLLLFCCFFIVKLFSTVIISQGISVYSSVSTTNVGIDDSVHYKLTIAGQGFSKNPDLPKLRDFSIILTGQYTGIDFSNGKPVPYTVFEYMFFPLREGTLQIPKINIRYKGYFYSSQEYQIHVGKKVKSVDFARESNLAMESFNGSSDGSAVFIQSKISQSNVFYNQQIVYTYTIYTRVPLLKIPKVLVPQMDAFYYEKLYYKREYWTKINGTTYRAFEFKFALFPFMTDAHIIPPIQLIVNSSDLANGGAGAGKRFSQSFSVNVSPLPLQDKPLSFSGLIGDFTITSEVEKKEVAISEFVMLTVKVKGHGNVRSIPHIQCPIMTNLQEYQSDVFVNFDRKKGEIGGEKLFRFALLPGDTGKETIPSIGFTYFDEKTGTYQTKWTDPIDIKIVKKVKTEKGKKTHKKMMWISLSAIILAIGGFFAVRKFIRR